MDLSNRNGNNKRKISQSKEREENSKKKNRENDRSIGCFRRCCTRKKREIISNQNEKAQQTSIENISKRSITHFTRSPLFNETTFCREVSEWFDDPCLQCNVQYGPDVWENILKYSNKQSSDQNQPLPYKRIKENSFYSLPAKEKSTHQLIKSSKTCVKLNIKDDNVDDAIDQTPEMIVPKSISHHELKRDSQSSTKFENDFWPNESTESSPDIMHSKQNLDSVFKQYQQNIEKTSRMSNHSSIHLRSDNPSSQNIPEHYNWNLPSSETNIDSSPNQEPYNWDYQEYQWSSPIDSSEKTQLADKLVKNPSQRSAVNDSERFSTNDEPTDGSYSIASGLSSNEREQIRSPSVDRNILISSLDIHKIREINDQSNTTGISADAKKQKSLNSESSSVDHSMMISNRPFRLLEVGIDHDDKKHVPSHRSIAIERRPLISPFKEIRHLKSTTNVDAKQLINKNLLKSHVHSGLNDKQKNQPSRNDFNHTLYQILSTYDDIMHSWRHFFERFSNLTWPSILTTDPHTNLSPSPTTSSTHSWSTITPGETLNLTQSDNIGPWWSRRDVYDRTPATFIFTNGSLISSYSIPPTISNKQMCISIENRPYDFNYYSCPNTCHCCCNSSLTINSNPSSA